jgi:hypothetical protein
MKNNQNVLRQGFKHMTNRFINYFIKIENLIQLIQDEFEENLMSDKYCDKNARLRWDIAG